MVEPAKNRMRNNLSEPLDWACAGRVLPKRNVSSRFIIIGGIFRKSSSKVMFADHDHMISALTPDRPDQSFNIPVLPGRAERRGPVPDAHCSDASFEPAAKCSVIVANEIFRRAVPGECLGNLARQPPRRRFLATANHNSCRRPWPRTRNANSCSKAIVGTTKRSIDAIPSA